MTSSRMTEGITCPCCGKGCDEPPLRYYSTKEAATYFCPPSRDLDRHDRLLVAINDLWQMSNAAIYECHNCKFGFAHPHIGGNEAFYETLHEQAGYPSDRWDYTQALECPAFLLSKGKVLDIGAGSGMFLKRLPSGWKPHAIESSRTMKDELSAAGIEVHDSTSNALKAGPFNLITLFQVLEHLAPFESIVEDAAAMLDSGGWLFITVPDGQMMTEQENRLGSPDMPPNHVNRWTPSSLAKVLARHGLVAESAVSEPSHPRLISKRLHLVIIQTAARNPGSLSAMVYRFRSRKVRAVLMSILAIGFTFRHAANLWWMSKGGAFAIAARKTT